MKKEEISALFQEYEQAAFLPSISVMAHDLASEMTRVSVRRKRLKDTEQIVKEQIDNDAAVRQMLVQRGIRLVSV